MSPQAQQRWGQAQRPSRGPTSGAQCGQRQSVLVVIDMQSQFAAAESSSLQERVVELIQHARANHWPIIVLEYASYGETVKSVTDAFAGYDLARVVSKTQNNGATEVLETCATYGFSTSDFLIAGVNIGACVKETVCGLATTRSTRSLTWVTAIMEACGDTVPGQWHQYPELTNFSLVPALESL